MKKLKPFHESIIDSIKLVFKNFKARVLNPETNGEITPVMSTYCLLSELEMLINLLENTIIPKDKLLWLEREISTITTDFFSDEDSDDIDDPSELRKKLLRLNKIIAKREGHEKDYIPFDSDC